MTYSTDLEQQAGSVKSVGYLSREHDYPKGETSELMFDRLASLVRLDLVSWVGVHECDLGICASNQTQTELYWRGMKIPGYCSSDILVPNRTVVYMAPALILHYIRSHQYLPPACFREAVLTCPEPGSDEYLRAIKQIAPNFGPFLDDYVQQLGVSVDTTGTPEEIWDNVIKAKDELPRRPSFLSRLFNRTPQ